MNSVSFTIVNGDAPFTAELVGSGIEPEVYTSTGTYTIYDVYNGVYNLVITDSNGCLYEQEVIVDPEVTTTTTTTFAPDSIIIGNAQDPMLIFNEVATNRNSEYGGETVTLYLWFKTLDGRALTSNKEYDYVIEATNIIGTSQFVYTDVSDQIHMEVFEGNTGPTSSLYGNIVLKTGFYEGYFEYVYEKGAVDQRFTVDLSAASNSIYTEIPTKSDAGTTYGIDILETDRITMDF